MAVAWLVTEISSDFNRQVTTSRESLRHESMTNDSNGVMFTLPQKIVGTPFCKYVYDANMW